LFLYDPSFILASSSVHPPFILASSSLIFPNPGWSSVSTA
jgi:hypothetical protein